MLLNCGVGEDSWESLGQQGDPTRSILKEISPEYSLEGLILKQKSQYLATWCEELTHLKGPWCWERLKVGGEGDDRGWDGWMASLTQWTWAWVNPGSWWWTGRPGVQQSMGSQSRTWLSNWTEIVLPPPIHSLQLRVIFPKYKSAHFASQCSQDKLSYLTTAQQGPISPFSCLSSLAGLMPFSSHILFVVPLRNALLPSGVFPPFTW